MTVKSNSRVLIQLGNFVLPPFATRDFRGYNFKSDEAKAISNLIKSGQIEVIKDPGYLLLDDMIEQEEQEKKPIPPIGRVFIE